MNNLVCDRWTLEELKKVNKGENNCQRCFNQLSYIGQFKKYCIPCEHELGGELTYKQKKDLERAAEKLKNIDDVPDPEFEPEIEFDLVPIGEDNDEVTKKVDLDKLTLKIDGKSVKYHTNQFNQCNFNPKRKADFAVDPDGTVRRVKKNTHKDTK